MPDTPILVGKTLTISGGNWINVRKDPAWTISPGGSNWTQVSRCAHLHPEWVGDEMLPDDHPEDCSHVVETTEIEIDGKVVETIYKYRDTVL